MREPVVIIIIGYLLLLAAVRFHPPDLHKTGTHGVEIDILPIGGILGAIVQTWRSRQSYFLTACCRYFIHIELPVPFPAKNKVFSIRGPAVQIRRPLGGDLFGCTSRYRNSIDNGAAKVFYKIAETKHFAVKRKNVIVI